jgi:hypothetical protein
MLQVYDGACEEIMKRSIAISAIILGMLGLGAVAGHPQNQQPATPMGGTGETHRVVPPAGPLEISYGGKSAVWTPAKLAALPHASVTVPNEHTKGTDTYSGVLLMDLLTPLGVPAGLHGGAMEIYLVAEGSDGFKAVYSLAEVNPALEDAIVIVADAVNGKPLTANGPLRLIDTRDKHPDRWVHHLVAIQVMTAE